MIKRTGTLVHTFAHDTGETLPAWSPDGARIATARLEAGRGYGACGEADDLVWRRAAWRGHRIWASSSDKSRVAEVDWQPLPRGQ